MSNRELHDWQRAVVTESRPVARGVRRIVLDLPGRPAARPGSHLDVLLPLASGEVVRSYSVVDDGRFPDHLSLGVRLDPNSSGGSAHMHLLRPGDEVITSAPVQTFDLSWGRPRYTLLAGGIGITPLVGMARRLRAVGADYRLVYVGRTREAMPFVDDLLADHAGRVQLHVGSEQGRIDIDALIRELPTDTEFYVCGPIEMLAAAKRCWAADGRRADRLRFETFGSGGTPRVCGIPGGGATPGSRRSGTGRQDAAGRIGPCGRRGDVGLPAWRVRALPGQRHRSPAGDRPSGRLSQRPTASGGRPTLCLRLALPGRHIDHRRPMKPVHRSAPEKPDLTRARVGAPR